MDIPNIAYIYIKDKDGKVYLYSLHEDRNVKSNFEYLTTEEIRKLHGGGIPWH